MSALEKEIGGRSRRSGLFTQQAPARGAVTGLCRSTAGVSGQTCGPSRNSTCGRRCARSNRCGPPRQQSSGLRSWSDPARAAAGDNSGRRPAGRAGERFRRTWTLRNQRPLGPPPELSMPVAATPLGIETTIRYRALDPETRCQLPARCWRAGPVGMIDFQHSRAQSGRARSRRAQSAAPPISPS